MTGRTIGGDPLPERGFMAGRLIDGFHLYVDGRPAMWVPPRWLEALELQGYDRTRDGEPFFVVTHVSDGELRRFKAVRPALAYGRSLIVRGRRPTDPSFLAIECRTPSGRTALVTWDRGILGMARGALDAEPIRVIETPEVLPAD